MTRLHIQHGVRRAAGLAMLLALAAAAGCETSATLKVGRGALIEGDALMAEYQSEEAIHRVDDSGRQFIILAFEPFDAGATADPNAPPPPGTEPAPAPGPAPAAHHYYLQLAVQAGGGDFTIPGHVPSGEVFAQLYEYEKGQDKPRLIRSALRGTIRTRPYYLVGGFTRDKWLTHGTFDLRMSGDERLVGEFTAEPGGEQAVQFLRNKHL
ncbi:MAG: hypothetical protein BIFFINMI_03731 [Phycisphaerae bacterium]|nr:hypothetical protein [Phycisphaerae bacterium]